MTWGFKKPPEPVDNGDKTAKIDDGKGDGKHKPNERLDAQLKLGAHNIHKHGEAPPRRPR